MLSPRNLGGVAVAGRICASPAFRRTDRIRRPRRTAMRARRPAGGAYRDGTNPRRASPLCSAGTSRLSRRSERTRHALDSMPGPSVRSGLVHGAHTVGLAHAIRWQAWTHERTRHRGCGPKPATRDQPGRGRNPNEPEPGRRALAGRQDCGSTAPVLALAGLSRGDSRTNPRGYGQGTASAAACNGVIAAAPLRLDLAPASRHLQVSLHPRALVRKEAGWPRKT